jgi:hypothetical protein
MNMLWKLTLFLTFAALSAGPVTAAPKSKAKSTAPTVTMFKCKDDRGRVYYSDKLGPECAQGNVHQLSRHGMRVEPQNASPSQAGAASTGAGRSLSAEQKRRDKALLATYSSEAQIEEAKQRNLALPTEALKQAEGKRDRAQKELSVLHGQADGYASHKKQIPTTLIEDVRGKEALVAKLTADAEKKRAHAAQIAERFDADKQRFRELTSQQAAR